MDPRSYSEPTTTTLADLDLLPAEDDDDGYLTLSMPEDVTRDSDDIDAQILAGLVAP
jgi:hypothetical protein